MGNVCVLLPADRLRTEQVSHLLEAELKMGYTADDSVEETEHFKQLSWRCSEESGLGGAAGRVSADELGRR